MDYSFILVVGSLGVFLVVAVLFMLTQFNTLMAIRPGNRMMKPSSVWLQIIPFFNFYWQFVVVKRIAESLQNELRYQAEDDSILGVADAALIDAVASHKRPTYQIGMWYCALYVAGTFLSFSGTATVKPGTLPQLASMVCWIIYWVQLAGYKRKLKALAL